MSTTQPYRWLAAALAASVAATLAACGASPAPTRTTAARHHAPAPGARTTRTYLTVVSSPIVTHPGGSAIRIERVRGTELVPVASYPQNNAYPLQLTGW